MTCEQNLVLVFCLMLCCVVGVVRGTSFALILLRAFTERAVVVRVAQTQPGQTIIATENCRVTEALDGTRPIDAHSVHTPPK